ncbi:unnamed protein product, partial [Effrenium voratum]
AGVASTSVTASTVISTTSVVWTLIGSVIFLKEKLTGMKVFGILCCMAGNAATLLGSSSGTDHKGAFSGDLLCVLAAMLYATYTTVLSRLVGEDFSVALLFGVIGVAILVFGAPLLFFVQDDLGRMTPESEFGRSMPWQRSKRLEQSENGKEADQQPIAKQETQVSLLQRLLPEQHGPEADELQAGAADETTELARPLVNIQGVPIAEHLNSVLPPSPSDVVQETAEPAGISAVSALQSQIERDTSGAEIASLLIHYANRYARSQTRPVRDPVLRKNPSPHDVERLTDAFSKDVRDLGFLTADCILREIDNACRLRRCAQGKLLNDPSSPEVGNLLKGVLKMLYTVETVLHTAFATQPVVTIADLEAAILQMPAFKQVSKFKEAELGELQKHPEVLRRLRLNEPSLPCLPMPKSFPSFSHEEIIKCLVASLPHRWQHWKNEDSWTLEKGLNIVAQQKGFSDSRLLGVFIQQEHVFRIIISIYKRRQLNHSQALGKAVQTALQQVERASKSNGATHHFDWNLWQQMLVAFSNLQQPEERFEFCQEWTWKAAGSKADTQLEKERREFWRLHCAPLLLATFTLATSKRLPAISAPQKLNYSRADVQSLPDLKWLGMESAKWQQTCSTG